jgi:L-threonine-O-3-phosphate decarboxylase
MAHALGQLCHYPDPHYTELRSALGAYHHVPADWVLPGNGAAELLTWVARDLAEQAQRCYLLTPAFSDYGRSLGAVGLSPQPVPLPLGPAAVPAWPDDPGAAVLINNPHNPTGTLLSAAALAPLLDRFATVVVDEAFMDFLPPNQQQSLIERVGQHPNLVVLRSLTKFYTLPGLRIGYAIGHPDRLRRWQGWRDPWPVNTLAAAAAIAAVQDTAFQERTWQWLPPARAALEQGLGAIPGLAPLAGAANYLLVATTTPAPALQETLLRRHQVLIRDCLSFPELGKNYFRVAVRQPGENERLVTALAEILGL